MIEQPTRRNRKPFGLRVLAVVAMLFSIAAACGIPTDPAPRAIATSDLPADLTNVERPTPGADGPQLRIWMVDEETVLTPVTRSIDELPADVADRAQLALETLLAGTFPEESRDGISSAISRGTTILSVTQGENGVLFVDLGEGSIVGSSREDQRQAFAQIVWTMTELPFIEQVIFGIDDRLSPVSVDGGISEPGIAVDRSFFPSLDPENRVTITFPDDSVSAEPTSEVPVAPTPIDALPPGALGGRSRPLLDLPIWLLDESGNLTRVSREVDERDPGQVLLALLAGPRNNESRQQIRTAILSTAVVTNIEDLDVDDATGTAFVDLGANSLPPVGFDDERLRALAQIVYTLTELSEIDQVTITVGGRGEPVPTQSGFARSSDPVTRDDYSVLVAEQVVGVSTPTPTTVQASPGDTAPPPPTATPTITAEPTASPTVTPTPTPTITPIPFELEVAPTSGPAPTPTPTP